MRRTVRSLFTPKARRLRYKVTITVDCLENVPLLSGVFYAKLRLPSTAAPLNSASATKTGNSGMLPSTTPSKSANNTEMTTPVNGAGGDIGVAGVAPSVYDAAVSSFIANRRTSDMSDDLMSSLNTPTFGQDSLRVNSLSVQISDRDTRRPSLSSVREVGSREKDAPAEDAAPTGTPQDFSTIGHVQTTPSPDGENGNAEEKSSLRSPLSAIHDHRVTWNWTVSFDILMQLESRGEKVAPARLRFTVKMKDDFNSKSSQKLGTIYVDLAHYAPHRESFTKHLLQDTNFNSSLRLKIRMTQVEGAKVSKRLPNAPAEYVESEFHQQRAKTLAAPHENISDDFLPSFPTHNLDYIVRETQNIYSARTGGGKNLAHFNKNGNTDSDVREECSSEQNTQCLNVEFSTEAAVSEIFQRVLARKSAPDDVSILSDHLDRFENEAFLSNTDLRKIKAPRESLTLHMRPLPSGFGWD